MACQYENNEDNKETNCTNTNAWDMEKRITTLESDFNKLKRWIFLNDEARLLGELGICFTNWIVSRVLSRERRKHLRCNTLKQLKEDFQLSLDKSDKQKRLTAEEMKKHDTLLEACETLTGYNYIALERILKDLKKYRSKFTHPFYKRVTVDEVRDIINKEYNDDLANILNKLQEWTNKKGTYLLNRKSDFNA